MRRAVLTAVLMGGLSWSVVAADLGNITIVSKQGEPFSARIEVLDAQAGTPVRLRLASESVYQRVNQQQELKREDVQIIPVSGSASNFEIKSSRVINMREFVLIIEMQAGSNNVAKLYRVKLPSNPQGSITPPKTGDKTSEKINSNNEGQVTNVGAKTASTVTTTQVQPQTQLQLTVQPAGSKITLPEKTTMWRLGNTYKSQYSKATLDQVVVAFVRKNPQAFHDGRVSGLVKGATLVVPTNSEVMAVPVDTAWAAVRIDTNANVIGEVSPALLQRARQAIAKNSPDLMPLVQARIDAEKAQQAKVEQQQKAQEEAKRKAQAERLAKEKAELERKAQLVNEQKKLEEHSNVAVQKEPSVNVQESITTEKEPASKIVPVPASMASESHVLGDPEEKVDALGELKKEKETSSSSVGLWVTLGGLVVFLVGIFFWWRRRTQQHDEVALRTVKFMREIEPTTDEQLRASAQMVKNRMQADEAAQRGFPNLPKQAEEASGTNPQAPINADPMDVNGQSNVSAESMEKLEPSLSVESEQTVRMSSDRVMLDEHRQEPRIGTVTHAVEHVRGRNQPRLVSTEGDVSEDFFDDEDFVEEQTDYAKQWLEAKQNGQLPTPEVARQMDLYLMMARNAVTAGNVGRAAQFLQEVAKQGTPQQKLDALELAKTLRAEGK